MQEALITAFSDTELKEVIDELYLDDTVDIIEEMPATVVKRILKSTDSQTRKSINTLLNIRRQCRFDYDTKYQTLSVTAR